MANENGQPAEPLPPYDLAAEEWVLAAMLTSRQAIDAVADTLDPGDFYRDTHRRIYRAALSLHQLGQPVDGITVTQRLQEAGQLDTLAETTILDLARTGATTSNVRHHAEIVAADAQRRRFATIGDELRRRSYDNATLDELHEIAARLLDTGRGSSTLDVETWHEFESQAHDVVPMLIDRIWPEAAFGFIAAPPKKGKTWVGLAVAVAVAAGRPLAAEFAAPAARPVLYVALEGHRAALRARVGAIARGLGIDPDGDQLDNLHWAYKPRGINLADPVWANRLHADATKIGAALVVVDVMRAAARIRENSNDDFPMLRANLQPLSNDGIAVAMLHHNVKLSEISKERDPGERMSGAGAMYGALDTAIYITGSEDHARKLRLEFDLRDGAALDPISIELQGDGTGDNGGFTYRDTAAFEIVEDEVDEDDFKKAPPQEIYDYIADQGGTVETTDVRAYFEISGDTLTRRIGRLAALGVEYTGGKGKAGRFTIPKAPEPPPPNLLDPPTLDAPQVAARPEKPHAATQPRAATEPHNHAGLRDETASTRTDPVRQPESADLQGKQKPQGAAPYGRASMPAATGSPESNGRAALREAEAWIDDTGFTRTPDQITQHLLDHWPTLGAHDHTTLRLRAAARAAAEAPEPDPDDPVVVPTIVDEDFGPEPDAPDEENAGGQ